MSDLPGGAQIPVTFKPGQPLTAQDLNKVQEALMQLLLTHDHSGNVLNAPQGVLIGPNGIAPNAVKGQHISVNAVTKGDIHNGAVGASEIQEKCIGSNHLVDGAISTLQIKDKAVTKAKLADEILALLNTPREGATTHAYCAYLDGMVVYPNVQGGKWFDWMLEANVPVKLHDLPIRRLREDGGWMPIRSILPPDRIRPNVNNLDLNLRYELAESFAGLLKANDRIIQESLGAPVVEVKPEGNQWSVLLRSGERRRLADGEMRFLLNQVRIDKVAQENLNLRQFAMEGPTEIRAEAVESIRQEVQATPNPLTAGAGYTQIQKVPFDPIAFLDPNPSDDRQERERTVMLVDPAAIGWQIPQVGVSYFQPGIGGNAIFSDTGQMIQFSPDRNPSKDEIVVLERILHHVGLENDERLKPDRLLANPKIYDFLNNPQLLAAGYWTGASRNIRAVVRMKVNGKLAVRVRFASPYTNSSYAINVTADFPTTGTSGLPVVAQVLSRHAEYVDLLFLRGNEQIDRLSFSIAIHGELAS